MDVYNLAYENNLFDLVMALEVLEHLDKPQAAIHEIKRVTKKYCLLSVPNEPFFSIGNLLRGKNVSLWGSDPEHIHKWNKRRFLKLLEKDFKVVEIRNSFPWLITLCDISNG